jgi:hypothetical protein
MEIVASRVHLPLGEVRRGIFALKKYLYPLRDILLTS